MKEEDKMKKKAIKAFKANLSIALTNCEVLYKMAESANLLDEQYFLDWLDNLNKISVRH